VHWTSVQFSLNENRIVELFLIRDSMELHNLKEISPDTVHSFFHFVVEKLHGVTIYFAFFGNTSYF
jgi:hypothetical protein